MISIPKLWLTIHDISCISKFLTRASFEKQLNLNAENSNLIYKLLIEFIENKGINCRIVNDNYLSAGINKILTVENKEVPNKIKQLNTLESSKKITTLIIHEVLRGLAQLFLSCADKLQSSRYHSLSSLLLYCNHRSTSIDIESRYAAIDGVGNIMLHPITDESYELIEQDIIEFSLVNDEKAYINANIIKQRKAVALSLIHEKCVQMLVDNLYSSISMIVRPNSVESNSSLSEGVIASKLLISCLRSISLALNAVTSSLISTSLFLQFQDPFNAQFQSLIQATHTIFERIVRPSLTVSTSISPSSSSNQVTNLKDNLERGRSHNKSRSQKDSDNDQNKATSTSSSRSGGSDHSTSSSISAVTSSESKLYIHTCKLLSSLAELNPSKLLSSWSLFLSDPMVVDNTLILTLDEIIQDKISMCRNTASIASHVKSELSLNMPVFKSPLFSAASRSQIPSVRVASIRCFKSLLKGLPLQKWFKAMKKGNKISSNTNKINILNTASSSSLNRISKMKLSLSSRSSSTNLLGDKITSSVTKIFRFIILSLSIEKDDEVIKELLSVASALLLDMPLLTTNIYNKKSQSINILEDLALALFQTVMNISLQTIPSNHQSNNGDACLHAMNWLSDICKLKPSLQSFDDAILWPFFSTNISLNSLDSHITPVMNNLNIVSEEVNWRSRAIKEKKNIVEVPIENTEENIMKLSHLNYIKGICSVSLISTDILPNGSYSNCIRALVNIIMLKYYNTVMKDQNYNLIEIDNISWFRKYMDSLLHSSHIVLRLLGAKLMCSILIEKQSYNNPNAKMKINDNENSDDENNDDIIADFVPLSVYTVGCYSIYEATIQLLKSGNDSDHQVRGQSIIAFGYYTRACWQYLSNLTSTIPNGSNLRLDTLKFLLNCSNDNVGTVRMVALKALGEATIRGALSNSNILSNSSKIKEINTKEAELKLIFEVLKCFLNGCCDSKLAVRIQAIWSLGNQVLLLLPARQKILFSTKNSIKPVVEVHPCVNQLSIIPLNEFEAMINTDNESTIVLDCIEDNVWINNANICMNLMDDSDKVLASTVRCLGFIAAGLSPWNQLHFNKLTSIVDALINRILLATNKSKDKFNSILGTDVDDIGVYSNSEIINGVCQSMQTISLKLLYSVCQALGFIGWVLTNRGSGNLNATNENISTDNEMAPGVLLFMERVRDVLAVMLRYGGKVKVQLQSCKALISLLISRNDDLLTDNIISSMEGAMIVASTLQKIAIFPTTYNFSPSSSPTISPTAMQSINSNNIIEASSISISPNSIRTIALHRSILVLIWSTLIRIDTCVFHYIDDNDEVFTKSLKLNYNDKILILIQSILYHSEELINWLEYIVSHDKLLTSEEFSLTSSPLASTAPNLPLPIISSTKSIGCSICKRILRLLKYHSRSSEDINDNYNGLTSSTYARLLLLIKEGESELHPGSPEISRTRVKSSSDFELELEAKKILIEDDDEEDDEL